MSREDLIQRVAQLDKIIIPHPAFAAAVHGIEDCLAKSKHYREPVGSLLLAEGGMGKTTAHRAVLSRLAKSTICDGDFERTIVPAFYFEIPSPATVKSVAASMLDALGAPSPHSGSSAAFMTQRLCKLLENAETLLVFIDEAQNLFCIGKRSTKINTVVCNWIKWMVNNTKVSFCLMGLPEFAPILSADSQLTRRFPMHFQLHALTPGDQEHFGALVPFIAEAMKQATQRLQLDAAPRFDTLLAATQVYAATGGNPSFVIKLIKEAVLDALCAGTAHVTLENFAAAWDSGVTARASIARNNPFRLSHGALAAALRRSA